MKYPKFLLIIAVMLFLKANSQNIYHPWILGVSTNYTDFNVVDRQFNDFFTKADWMGKSVPTMVTVGRYLNPSFSICGVLSNVTLEGEKLNKIPLLDSISNSYSWRFGVQGEYKFSNRYLLSERSRFDPYFFVGINISNINGTSYLDQSTGIGSNFWITDYFGANFQASFEYLFNFNNYMHYSFGLVGRLGRMIDKDNDNVPDRIDKCPDIEGLEKFNGCPDYDGDGIMDNIDRCPREYGKRELNGCPDSDNDGIPDIDDQCPNVFGTKEFKGCPVPNKPATQTGNENKLLPEENSIVQPQTKKIEVTPQTTTLETSSKNSLIINEEGYYIIAGSFEKLEKAVRLNKKYKSEGYNSELVGQNEQGLYRVSVAYYPNRNEAEEALKKFKEKDNPKAWILKK